MADQTVVTGDVEVLVKKAKNSKTSALAAVLELTRLLGEVVSTQNLPRSYAELIEMFTGKIQAKAGVGANETSQYEDNHYYDYGND